MALRQVTALVVMFLAGLFLACASPQDDRMQTVAGVDPNDQDLTRELLALDRQIATLDAVLNDYPPEFSSEKERRKIHALWFSGIERASVVLNIDFDNPELFLRTGILYRQGYFLDIPDAASSSYNNLTRCISLAPGHVECRYELARLLLASSPRFAPTAEQLLLEARSLIQPATRPEFEAALARAYLAQGRRSAALRQIDHYLTLRPGDLDAQRFRSALMFESDRGADRE